MNPRDKVVVVTGAGGGIGGALVDELLRAGARHVVAADLRVDGLRERTGMSTKVLDVTDEVATRVLVSEVALEFGPIDMWFANAGIANGGELDASVEIWDRYWNVNVMSHVFAARALFPEWEARGSGHLVTTASMAGLLTEVSDAVYTAAKHAALGLSEWLAIRSKHHGIVVSCICPGAVNTEMLRGTVDSGDAATASANVGAGVVLEPVEAARRIVAALDDDRFLILTHPEMSEFVRRKVADPTRWIASMARMWNAGVTKKA